MITNMENVTSNITEAIDGVGKTGTIMGIQFEVADPRLLDVRDGDFNEHVSMQPAAIAYYGMLKKVAGRNLEVQKRAYERWSKKTYSQAKAALEAAGNKKPTIADVEAFVLMNNEKMIDKFEKDVQILQEQSDTMDVWYEGWRQKSFSLREYGSVLSDERFTSPHIMANEEQDYTTPRGRRTSSPTTSQSSGGYGGKKEDVKDVLARIRSKK